MTSVEVYFPSLFFFPLQLRQWKRWFILYKLHLATIEYRTSPECHRSRAKGLLCYEQGGSLKGGVGDQNGHSVPDTLRQVLDSRHAVQHFIWVSLAQVSLVSVSGFCGCTCSLGLCLVFLLRFSLHISSSST